ncbi:MAG: hypothetical protein AAGF12_13055 [Myxococcota bacterium]
MTAKITKRVRPLGGGRKRVTQAGDAAYSMFYELGWAIGDLRRRRHLRRALRRAGNPVAIGAAKEGWIRITGTCELLDPVISPTRERVAAYWVHRQEEEQLFLSGTNTPVTCMVTYQMRDAGRFIIRDGGHVAVLGFGSLVLITTAGDRLDPGKPGSLILRGGDPVTVVGEASFGDVPSASAVMFAGFRKVSRPLVFGGSATNPTYVLTQRERQER